MRIIGEWRAAAVACMIFAGILESQCTIAKGEMTMAEDAGSTSSLLYVGTYTGKGSEGIYKFRLDHTSGELALEGLAAKINNPSFLALSPDKEHLYCVSEIADFQGKKAGGVTSFLIQTDGGLQQLTQAPSGGLAPCYVSATTDGEGVLVANYTSGDVAYIPTVDGGALMEEPTVVHHHEGSSVHPSRQKEPHAHCIMPDPSGKWAVAVDLGIDKVIAYPLTSGMITSSPVENKVHPGAGPRHIAFHPDGKFGYVANELDSTISLFDWDDSAGKLTERGFVKTLLKEFNGDNYPSEVLVHPNGKFVYLGNRGHNSIATFAVDEQSGELKLVNTESTRGEFPRGMVLHPSGKFLVAANQNSGNIIVYRIGDDGLPVFASEYKGLSKPAGLRFR